MRSPPHNPWHAPLAELPLPEAHGTVIRVTVAAMSWWQVIVLAVLQGLTEFLPVSSSGHLAIASRVFFADDAGASFTAVIQIGTELAVLLYFARDIGRIVKAWFNGLFVATHRDLDYWMGWYVIIGTIPIGVLGFLLKDQIRTGARNLWVIATALIVFSAVIAAAEYFGRQSRHAEDLTWRDSIVVGLAQCLALVPGVSRSGATISAGLFLGLDRELAARFGFLLAIPAVFASGLFSLPDAFHPVSEGMSASGSQLLVATMIAFVIGFAAVSWFLRFLVRHSMYWFVGYRVTLGVVVLVLLATGVVTAT
jgi:undecaprenyl-diphosphatase